MGKHDIMEYLVALMRTCLTLVVLTPRLEIAHRGLQHSRGHDDNLQLVDEPLGNAVERDGRRRQVIPYHEVPGGEDEPRRHVIQEDEKTVAAHRRERLPGDKPGTQPETWIGPEHIDRPYRPGYHGRDEVGEGDGDQPVPHQDRDHNEEAPDEEDGQRYARDVIISLYPPHVTGKKTQRKGQSDLEADDERDPLRVGDLFPGDTEMVQKAEGHHDRDREGQHPRRHEDIIRAAAHTAQALAVTLRPILRDIFHDGPAHPEIEEAEKTGETYDEDPDPVLRIAETVDKKGHHEELDGGAYGKGPPVRQDVLHYLNGHFHGITP